MIDVPYSLPYTPGILELLSELPTNKINDIYFSDNLFGSARALELTDSDFTELQAIRQRYGIKLHYLVNGNHYTNEFYENVSALVEHITALDIDIVTMNNTYIMNDVHVMTAIRTSTTRGVEIKNSVNNKPQTLKDVIFLVETLSISNIILDRSLNRNIDELKKISQYAKTKGVTITILVNEGCIVDCMWKNFDDMMISQTTAQSNIHVISFVHNQLGCTKHFETHVSEYLKTGFTLPNDLDKFTGLVDIIKLAGRGISTSKWLAMCKAYMYNDGNTTLQLLLSTRPPNQLLNISSNQLDDVGFNKITTNCKNVCGTECVLCDNIAHQLVK
jgi:collagenase-like PrtC family protease